MIGGSCCITSSPAHSNRLRSKRAALAEDEAVARECLSGIVVAAINAAGTVGFGGGAQGAL